MEPRSLAQTILINLLVTAFVVGLYIMSGAKARTFLSQKDKRGNRDEDDKDAIAGRGNERGRSDEAQHQSNLIKERLSMILAHDLESPLRFLVQITKDVCDKIDNTCNSDDVILACKEINQTTTKIYHLVHDFRWWIKSLNQYKHISLDIIDLNEQLRQQYSFYKEQLAARGNRLILPSAGTVEIITNEHLLKIIIGNIIDNANKHTLNGLITVTLLHDSNKTDITITDTGKGMTALQLGKIKAYLFSAESDAGALPGYGFRFIKDFCAFLKIEIDINASPDKGTSVCLSGFVPRQQVQ